MARVRRELRLRGGVQGVGLRPWAARRARELGLAGRVANAGSGVRIELEGEETCVEAWIAALRSAPPPGARVEALAQRALPCRGERGFRVAPSAAGAEPAGVPRLPPDAPLCAECRDELFDPASRRHRYPFTHCARCGPRASLLLGLPYDRSRTTLAAFPPCGDCRREYASPADRRYHAESVACPRCGPRLVALEPGGDPRDGDPVELAVACLRGGGIAALKGYGGFHLAVDATSQEAVLRLRKRKARPAKPFAVLVPDLAQARGLAHLRAADEALLAGPEHAVVVAPRREAGCAAAGIARAVAPGTHELGLLLPHAPLHWLLFFAPGQHPLRHAPRLPPLVLTSANASGEPTLHANDEARERLAGIADLVLAHDREVARPSDDPVFASAASGPVPIRLSRGTAPLALPLDAPFRAAAPVLAVGGDLKCAPALAVGDELLLAEHVGDLASARAADALVARALSLCRLAGLRPALVAHDLHPGYVGSGLARRLAAELGAGLLGVQHHHAHAVACLVENRRAPPALALCLDGLGFGSDGALWGGELLRVEAAGFERLAHLEPVPLPGGDAAAREPWRMAAVWLQRAFPEGAPRLPWHARRDARELRRLEQIAERGLASPSTTSCGRLFDAAASLLDLVDRASHEGEAALALESLAAGAAPRESASDDSWPASAPCEARGPRVIPVADLVRELAWERARGTPAAESALRFHERLAARLVAAAVAAAGRTGLRAVCLSGGCLQNRLLLASLRRGLAAAGLEPLLHRRLPPNDAGLAVGQAAVAAAWRGDLASAGAPPSEASGRGSRSGEG